MVTPLVIARFSTLLMVSPLVILTLVGRLAVRTAAIRPVVRPVIGPAVWPVIGPVVRTAVWPVVGPVVGAVARPVGIICVTSAACTACNTRGLQLALLLLAHLILLLVLGNLLCRKGKLVNLLDQLANLAFLHFLPADLLLLDHLRKVRMAQLAFIIALGVEDVGNAKVALSRSGRIIGQDVDVGDAGDLGVVVVDGRSFHCRKRRMIAKL